MIHRRRRQYWSARRACMLVRLCGDIHLDMQLIVGSSAIQHSAIPRSIVLFQSPLIILSLRPHPCFPSPLYAMRSLTRADPRLQPYLRDWDVARPTRPISRSERCAQLPPPSVRSRGATVGVSGSHRAARSHPRPSIRWAVTHGGGWRRGADSNPAPTGRWALALTGGAAVMPSGRVHQDAACLPHAPLPARSRAVQRRACQT